MEVATSPPPGIAGHVGDPCGGTWGSGSHNHEPNFTAGGAVRPELSLASMTLHVGEPHPAGYADQKKGAVALVDGGITDFVGCGDLAG
jgi:hypothetical protein